MPPKKQNRSPFGLFMAKMRRDDSHFRSLPMSQLVPQCEGRYAKISPEMKTRFEKLSSLVRNSGLNETQINQELDKLNLMDDNNDWDDQSAANSTLNNELSNSMAQQLSLEEKEVDLFEIVVKAIEGTKNFPKKIMVCICFNVLVHTFEDKYYPNEIGLIKFGLEEGIKEVYTKLIASEPPDGYYAKAKEFSEMYHKLPVNVKNRKDFERDVLKLFNEIYNFMSASDIKGENKQKLVFCKTEERTGMTHRDQVIGCLQWLDEQYLKASDDTHRSLIIDFEIVELSDLLFLTTKKYCKIPRPIATCIEALTRSVFDYYPNMRCAFHSLDDNNYCAQAIVYRSIYLFFDMLFALETNLELNLKPNESNRPSEPNIETVVELPTPTASIIKTRPQFRYSIENKPEEEEDLPNKTQPNPCPQIGVGRGQIRNQLKK